MQQWGNVLGGEDPVRQLYFDGRSTPPRPPPPPPTSQYGREGHFLQATPRDGAVRTPDGPPQFQHAYVTNRDSFTTPPHPTSTSWASQLATPQTSPSWFANGSSLCAPIAPYDPQIEEARLNQAITLGTSSGTTLMQSSSGFSHTSINEACFSRMQLLQGVVSRFPLMSRSEHLRLSVTHTLINPLGTPEPFGNKNLFKQLERTMETSINLEQKNSGGTINLTLLGMPGQATAEYLEQVQRAWNIVTRGMLQKPVIGALTNNLVVMLEPKGEIQAAGLKAIVNAPNSQQAIDLVKHFSTAHVTIFKYLTQTATTELQFIFESQYECLTRAIFNALVPFLHRTVVERLNLETSSAAKLITIQSLLWNLLLAPNTPAQQNGHRMHPVNEVNLPLPDMPISDMKTLVYDRELSYLLAHGVQPHPTDSAKFAWIKGILPKKYLPALASLEAIAIGTGTGSHPPLHSLWTMLEEMVSTQESPQPDAISTIHKVGFRPPRESTPGPRGSVVARGEWELTRGAEVIPDLPNRFDRHLAGRRGDETFDPTGRNREREYYRRRDPSEDRTDGGHYREYDHKRRPFAEDRRRSQERDVDLSQRREFSRSRSREPEKPADGAKGSTPKAEKEKGRTTVEKDADKTKVAPDRKKSRSPSAEPESLYTAYNNHYKASWHDRLKQGIAALQDNHTQLLKQ